MNKDSSILLTIDVEDWFQVENFKPWIPFSSWSDCELRVEKNVHRLLDLMDFCSGQQIADSKCSGKLRATFFILAWLAERFPHLVREIHARGHEVASHGYFHNLCNRQSTEELRKDLIESKNLLENIIGAPVFGYRAPSFSINNEILQIIKDCGYLYDSSFNSFDMHDRYGKVVIGDHNRKGITFQAAENFWEIPISNLTIGKRIFPLGGGGYFRMIPFCIFGRLVQSILNEEKAYVFYVHPWEIDPDQPKVNDAYTLHKFRHYVNIRKTYSKLFTFLKMFNQYRFVTCRQYLQAIGIRNY